MNESDNNERITIAVIATKLDNLISQVAQLEKKMTENYVTNSDFWPIKTIVYAGSGIVLVGVFTAIVALVIKQ